LVRGAGCRVAAVGIAREEATGEARTSSPLCSANRLWLVIMGDMAEMENPRGRGGLAVSMGGAGEAAGVLTGAAPD
jgi:hypothetical protein